MPLLAVLPALGIVVWSSLSRDPVRERPPVEPAPTREAPTAGAPAGGIMVRRAPRVSIRVSAKGTSGTIERSIRSSPVVGP